MPPLPAPSDAELRAALAAQGIDDPEVQAVMLRTLRTPPNPWALARWLAPLAHPRRHNRHA